MTSTIDASPEAPEETTTVEESKKRGRNPDRDFTKAAQRHQDLADFINAHPAYVASGLPPITPVVIKAVQLLTEDYRNTDEQKAARKAREEKRREEEKAFAGLSPEDVKDLKAANRKLESLEKAAEKRDAILARAAAAREAAEASGEDLAAVVESESDDSEPEKRGRIGRRR